LLSLSLSWQINEEWVQTGKRRSWEAPPIQRKSVDRRR
jgi:hypothetical protein